MSWGEVKKVNSDLTMPLNEGGVKIVKSIQKGTVTPNGTTSVTINKIDPAKTIVILQNSKAGNSAGQLNMASLVSLTETTFSVTTTYDGWNPSSVSWQVVEFY